MPRELTDDQFMEMMNQNTITQSDAPVPRELTDAQFREMMARPPLSATPPSPSPARGLMPPQRLLHAAAQAAAAGTASPEQIRLLENARMPVPLSPKEIESLSRSERRAIEGQSRDVRDVLSDVSVGEMLPFAGGIIRTRNDYRRNKQIEEALAAEAAGNVRPEQRTLLAVERARAGQETTFMAGATDIATQSLPFMVEFVATSGLFSIGSAGTKLALRAGGAVAAAKGAKGLLATTRAVNAAKVGASAKAAGFLGGSALQTVGLSPRIYENFNQRWREEQEKFVRGEDSDGFKAAMAKAFGDTYIEVMSERSGGLLGKLPGAQRLAGLKAGIMLRWMKKSPSRTLEQFLARTRNAAAWNGILGEVFEEHVGDVGRRVFLGDELPYKDAKDFLYQSLQMGTAFTLPAIAGMSARKLESKFRPAELDSQDNIFWQKYLADNNGDEGKAWKQLQADAIAYDKEMADVRAKVLQDIEDLQAREPESDIERETPTTEADIIQDIMEDVDSDQETEAGLGTVLEGREEETGRAVPDEAGVRGEREAGPVLQTEALAEAEAPPQAEEAASPDITPSPPAPARAEDIAPVPGTGTMSETTTMLDEKASPLTDVPLSDIRLGRNEGAILENFKKGTDPNTGINEKTRLEGRFHRTGTPPILIWQRKDGVMEVATGRNRLDLARRTPGVDTINAQIIKEEDGFTKERAEIMDAIFNIRDGQGDLTDYAELFRRTRPAREEALVLGILSRRGKDGYILGVDAKDDLYNSWRNGEITDAKALAIAKSAPGNEVIQRIALRKALDDKGMDANRLANYTMSAKMFGDQVPSEQTDLFGQLDGLEAQEEIDRVEDYASKRQSEINDQLRILNLTKIDPKKASEVGVDIDIKDPAAVEAKKKELQALKQRWSEWIEHPDLRAEAQRGGPVSIEPTPGPVIPSPEDAGQPSPTTASGASPDYSEQVGNNVPVRRNSKLEEGEDGHYLVAEDGMYVLRKREKGEDSFVDVYVGDQDDVEWDARRKIYDSFGSGVLDSTEMWSAIDTKQEPSLSEEEIKRLLQEKAVELKEGKGLTKSKKNELNAKIALLETELSRYEGVQRAVSLPEAVEPTPGPGVTSPPPTAPQDTGAGALSPGAERFRERMESAKKEFGSAQEKAAWETIQKLHAQVGERGGEILQATPEDVAAVSKESTRVRAWHKEGKTWFNLPKIIESADAVKKQFPKLSKTSATRVAAAKAWAHEIGIHQGIDVLFKDTAERDAFLQSVYDSVGESKIRSLIGEFYDSVTDQKKLAEEYLGYSAEQVVQGKALAEESGWYKFVQKVQAFLAKAGVPVTNKTHAQQVAADLIQGMREGTAPAAPEGTETEQAPNGRQDTMFASAPEAIAVYGTPERAVRAYMNQLSVVRREKRVVDKESLTLLSNLIDSVKDPALRKEARQFMFDTASESQQRSQEFKSLSKKETSDMFEPEQGMMFAAETEEPLSNVAFVFSPSQIKSADPATYDDQGNLIPLSQRFNPQSEDIRFAAMDAGASQADRTLTAKTPWGEDFTDIFSAEGWAEMTKAERETVIEETEQKWKEEQEEYQEEKNEEQRRHEKYEQDVKYYNDAVEKVTDLLEENGFIVDNASGYPASSRYLSVKTKTTPLGYPLWFKVRISDHAQPSGGGFSQERQERYGEADIDVRIDLDDGTFNLDDVSSRINELYVEEINNEIERLTQNGEEVPDELRGEIPMPADLKDDINFAAAADSPTMIDRATSFIQDFIAGKNVHVGQWNVISKKAGEEDQRDSFMSREAADQFVNEMRMDGWVSSKDYNEPKPQMSMDMLPFYKYWNVKQLKDLFNLALGKQKLEHSLFEDIFSNAEGQSTLQDVISFRRWHRDEYNRLAKWYIQQDVDATGFRVKQDGEEFVIFNTLGEEVGRADTEDTAWTQADLLRSNELAGMGFSPDAVQAYLNIRSWAHKSFKQLRDAHLYYAQQNLGKNHESTRDLIKALNEMGELRGWYYPRMRQFGDYVLVRTKEGENPVRKHYMSKTARSTAARWWSTKGWEVTLIDSSRMAQEAYQGADVIALDSLMGAALDTATSKEGSGVQAEIRDYVKKDGSTERQLIVTGPSAIRDVMLEHKGRFYQDAWHFTGDNLEGLKKDIVTAVENVVDEGILEYHEAVVRGLANTLRANTSRSHKMKRSTATGKDVYMGYEEDLLKAFVTYGRSISSGTARTQMAHDMYRVVSGRQTSWAEYKKEALEADPDVDLKRLRQEYRDEVKDRRLDPAGQRDAYAEAVQYIKEQLRNPTQTEMKIATLRGLTSAWYLSGMFAPAVVNITAMASTVPGAMHLHGGIPIRKVPGLIMQASRDYTLWALQSRWNIGPGVSAEKKVLFDEMWREGLMAPQYSQEAFAVLKGRFGNGFKSAVDIATLMFSQSEQFNRAVTIYASYMGMGKLGEKVDPERLNRATFVSNRAHGVYGKVNMPGFARGSNVGGQVLRSTMMFKMFTLNYVHLLKESLQKKDFKSAAYMLSANAVMAGPAAMLGYGAIKETVTLIFKAFGLEPPEDPEQAVYDWIETEYGTGTRRGAQYGLFGMMGVNLQGSLQAGLDDLPTDLKGLLGAPFSLLSDFAYGSADIAKGDIVRGAEKMAPRLLKSRIRAYREATEGVTKRTGQPVFYGKDQVRGTMPSTILRLMEFNPVSISEKTERQWKEEEIERKWTAKRADIYKRIRQVALAGFNSDDWANIIADVNEYNQSVQRQQPLGVPAITPTSIKSAARRAFAPPKKELQRELP